MCVFCVGEELQVFDDFGQQAAGAPRSVHVYRVWGLSGDILVLFGGISRCVSCVFRENLFFMDVAFEVLVVYCARTESAGAGKLWFCCWGGA